MKKEEVLICSQCFEIINKGYFCSIKCQDKYWGTKKTLSMKEMQEKLILFGKESPHKEEVKYFHTESWIGGNVS